MSVILAHQQTGGWHPPQEANPASDADVFSRDREVTNRAADFVSTCALPRRRRPGDGRSSLCLTPAIPSLRVAAALNVDVRLSAERNLGSVWLETDVTRVF
jgi:hypothetical protein